MHSKARSGGAGAAGGVGDKASPEPRAETSLSTGSGGGGGAEGAVATTSPEQRAVTSSSSLANWRK